MTVVNNEIVRNTETNDMNRQGIKKEEIKQYKSTNCKIPTLYK